MQGCNYIHTKAILAKIQQHLKKKWSKAMYPKIHHHPTIPHHGLSASLLVLLLTSLVHADIGIPPVTYPYHVLQVDGNVSYRATSSREDYPLTAGTIIQEPVLFIPNQQSVNATVIHIMCADGQHSVSIAISQTTSLGRVTQECNKQLQPVEPPSERRFGTKTPLFIKTYLEQIDNNQSLTLGSKYYAKALIYLRYRHYQQAHELIATALDDDRLRPQQRHNLQDLEQHIPAIP